jgi:hypothetical protein
MTMRLAGKSAILGWAAMLALAALPAGAQGQKSAEQISADIAQRYKTQVLRVTPIDNNGKPAYAVRVLSPGGDFDDAYRVVTLVVDAGTGELVAQFRHRTSGYDVSGARLRLPGADGSGDAIRRETFR